MDAVRFCSTFVSQCQHRRGMSLPSCCITKTVHLASLLHILNEFPPIGCTAHPSFTAPWNTHCASTFSWPGHSHTQIWTGSDANWVSHHINLILLWHQQQLRSKRWNKRMHSIKAHNCWLSQKGKTLTSSIRKVSWRFIKWLSSRPRELVEDLFDLCLSWLKLDCPNN